MSPPAPLDMISKPANSTRWSKGPGDSREPRIMNYSPQRLDPTSYDPLPTPTPIHPSPHLHPSISHPHPTLHLFPHLSLLYIFLQYDYIFRWEGLPYLTVHISNMYHTLRDIVSYAVICRVCPRHGMQIHIQTCTCADRYTYSYLDMSMSSAVCRWVLLERSIGCVPHPYRERHFSP